MALIELKNVTKTYGTEGATFEALKGLNLQIEDGEFLALMGPSGSGKSTTMNIAACLDTLTSGSYLFQDIVHQEHELDEQDDLPMQVADHEPRV